MLIIREQKNLILQCDNIEFLTSITALDNDFFFSLRKRENGALRESKNELAGYPSYRPTDPTTVHVNIMPNTSTGTGAKFEL